MQVQPEGTSELLESLMETARGSDVKQAERNDLRAETEVGQKECKRMARLCRVCMEEGS